MEEEEKLEEPQKTIEQIAEEHCSPDSQGCIIGILACRNGGFVQLFAQEFPQNETPEKVKDVFIQVGIEMMAFLKTFDKG